MKKLITVMFIICIISLLPAGCNLDNYKTTEPSVLKISTPNFLSSPEIPNTTETMLTIIDDLNGETIEIVHGKDFSVDDISFLLMLHGKTRNDYLMYDKPPHYKLDSVLDFAKNGNPIFLAHFENPYIICAYALESEEDNFGFYEFDVTKYVWYKFYNPTQVFSEIDGMNLTNDSYLIYDCTIISDIVNGIEYNNKGKYYLEYNGADTYDKTTSDMLLYFDFVNWMTGELWFIKYPQYGGSAFDVCTDQNGEEYLYFCYNYAKNNFGEHYDPLLQHFEILNEVVNEESGTVIKYAGIKLDMLVKYLNTGR